MAGIHFTFDNFKQLMQLNIGISDRLDENRAESFTLLYCDFSEIPAEVIDDSISQILRTSDSIANEGRDYFFVLSYPADGEAAEEILGNMQDSVSTFFKKDLHCLDRFAKEI